MGSSGRNMRSAVAVATALAFTWVLAQPPVAEAIAFPPGGWGAVRDYRESDMPEIDLTCTGTFEGGARRLADDISWKSLPSKYFKRPEWASSQASFRIDSVIKGPQELVGQSITVLYAPLAELLKPGVQGPQKEDGLGFEFYSDIPASVAGRRCLLLLKEQGPGTYEVFRDCDFMVCGEKPEVADWAALEPLQRLQCEFASAVRVADPGVAYLATYSATRPYNKAAGPQLLGALRANLETGDVWFRQETVAGLVRLNDLDTIYKLKDLFQEWRQGAGSGIDPSALGASLSLQDVTDRNAVPALVELSTDQDGWVRAGATYALRFVGGDDVISALAARLSDENSWVRYDAIMGLANHLGGKPIVGKGWKGFAPTFETYQEDPQTPVNNWKTWWQTNKAKYPSLDMMLQKAARFRAERPWAHKDASTP